MIEFPDSEARWCGLMRAAQDGDRAAYECLLREIVPFITALISRKDRNAQWTEDAVQDVLLTLHRVRHTYDPARPFKPWLSTITARRTVDLYRKRSRLAAKETSNNAAYETFADPEANRSVEVYDNTDGLPEALATLTPPQREAVELLKLKELSLKEAAKLTGRSEGALKVNVHRAMQSLRARLAGVRRS